MAEQTARQRIAEAVRRKCVGPCGLSSDMARVLACIVTRVADGAVIPHQELLAAELGLPLRTLSRCISHLGRAHGLVFVQRVGREPARYHVVWTELEVWAEFRCANEGVDTPNGGSTRQGGASRTAFDTPNGGSTRQGGASKAENGPFLAPVRAESSSSSSPSSSGSREIGDEIAFNRLVDDAVAVLRSGSVRVAYRKKALVAMWLKRGLTLDDFAAAADGASDYGVPAWKYAERILEERWRGPLVPAGDESGVVQFEAFRGLRPWVGA